MEGERGEDEHVKLDVCALLLLLLLLMSPLNVWILNLGIKYSCGGALDPHVGLLTNKHSSLLDFTSALNVSWSKDTLRCCYRLQVLSVWYDQLWRIKCQNVGSNLVIYQLNRKWTDCSSPGDKKSLSGFLMWNVCHSSCNHLEIVSIITNFPVRGSVFHPLDTNTFPLSS